MGSELSELWLLSEGCLDYTPLHNDLEEMNVSMRMIFSTVKLKSIHTDNLVEPDMSEDVLELCIEYFKVT